MVKQTRKQRVSEFLINKRKLFIDTKRELLRLFEFLNTHFKIDPVKIYSECADSEFSAWFGARKSKLNARRLTKETSSTFDCRALYLLVRCQEPEVVIETGVKYGASSAHILEALNKNDRGKLYSLDFPAEPGYPSRDFLIRDSVKDRWEFIAGDIHAELPKLMNSLDNVDFFFHDSFHSFRQMLWEYETVSKKICRGGILSSHDVLSLPGQKNAFVYFCKKNRLSYKIFRNVGVAFIRTN